MRRRSLVKIDTSPAWFLDASRDCLQLQLFTYDFTPGTRVLSTQHDCLQRCEDDFGLW